MAVNSLIGSSTSGCFEIEEFRIDDSLLTSDLVQSDDCSINMLAQISNAIPVDDHKKERSENYREILHSNVNASGNISSSTLKSTPRKKLVQSYGEDSGNIPEAIINRSMPKIQPYHQAEKQRKNKRSKLGCWTCRLRHKACPEDNDPCSACTRLGLICDWSVSRPSYMTDSKKGAARLKQIRNSTDRLRKRFCRVHQ